MVSDQSLQSHTMFSPSAASSRVSMTTVAMEGKDLDACFYLAFPFLCICSILYLILAPFADMAHLRQHLWGSGPSQQPPNLQTVTTSKPIGVSEPSGTRTAHKWYPAAGSTSHKGAHMQSPESLLGMVRPSSSHDGPMGVHSGIPVRLRDAGLGPMSCPEGSAANDGRIPSRRRPEPRRRHIESEQIARLLWEDP